MLRLFKFIFTGDFHCHKWQQLDEYYILNQYGNKVGVKYNVQCEHCGKITSFKV